jgi:flagellar basal body rod protein FlgB
MEENSECEVGVKASWPMHLGCTCLNTPHTSIHMIDHYTNTNTNTVSLERDSIETHCNNVLNREQEQLNFETPI